VTGTGSDREGATDSDIAARVAVNTDNITRLWDEQERIRERLHTLESDRATVLLLAQKVSDLSAELPVMVKRAATDAAQAVADKAADRAVSVWQVRAAILASFASLVGVAYLVAAHF
jgi:predicted translin family RNA/ssDNA-binding protein